MLNKSRVWSLYLVSFLVGLRIYQHPLVHSRQYFVHNIFNSSLFYHLTGILPETELYEMWGDLDTLQTYLYSYTYHPEDDHMSGRNMWVVAI